ncbi:hypothetical protein [Tortoise microvirus 36]|nr:hypothetical protein [Tortoise microvirus 36]
MKNALYCLYNTLSTRYGDVVCFPSDAFAIQRIRENLKPEMLKEIELCKIGYIDIDTGIAEVHPPIRLSLAVDDTGIPIDNLEK